MEIVTIDSLTFTGDKTLTYVGMGISSNGGDGVSFMEQYLQTMQILVSPKKPIMKWMLKKYKRAGTYLSCPRALTKIMERC